MHIRWRGLELPARVDQDASSKTDGFGRFVVEPFERGFGTTIGNSLRRILLSSIEGAAITGITIKGVEHEFTTMPGVMEDVTDLILNLKGVVVSMDGDVNDSRIMKLSASGPGEVKADLIEADPSITIHNPDHVIATLTDDVSLEIELIVRRGRGYEPASDKYTRSSDDQVIGEIPMDSVFSPVQRVRYRVEDTRVGQKTNYDRLVIDVWTDGTITPDMALVESAKILRKHLNPFVQFGEIGTSVVSEEAAAVAAVDEELINKLNMSVMDLDLTVRANNCLETAQVETVAELVVRDEASLLAVRSFGKTSLREVKKKLEDLGLSLGMQLPEGYQAPESTIAPH
ncbi:MAG: DNA-directed RNA polymerase subunit alpha [Phycisphaerales bacterium]|nr:DNA-directed RNA polymerase subunit alpha [Phycisphaerales bacterium]|tara:strand:+ start:30253 stop:31281 length:1029 start_codon:yes stop_codon:yes gene_type:complete